MNFSYYWLLEPFSYLVLCTPTLAWLLDNFSTPHGSVRFLLPENFNGSTLKVVPKNSANTSHALLFQWLQKTCCTSGYVLKLLWELCLGKFLMNYVSWGWGIQMPSPKHLEGINWKCSQCRSYIKVKTVLAIKLSSKQRWYEKKKEEEKGKQIHTQQNYSPEGTIRKSFASLCTFLLNSQPGRSWLQSWFCTSLRVLLA